jgi:cysteinyl-tRNA synthetase
MEAARSKKYMIEEEETARMRYEDTYARLLRIESKCEEAVEKNKELRELKEKAGHLQEEDASVNRALARSKPLVTEIMEYFNQKESENNNKEERVETLVEALQVAIEECLIAE